MSRIIRYVKGEPNQETVAYWTSGQQTELHCWQSLAVIHDEEDGADIILVNDRQFNINEQNNAGFGFSKTFQEWYVEEVWKDWMAQVDVDELFNTAG